MLSEKIDLNVTFDTTRPSLENLSYALRHPETWPDGFAWNYADCESCAMGLAAKLWESMGEIKEAYAAKNHNITKMAKAFSLSYSASKCIFYDAEKTRFSRERHFFGLIERKIEATHADITPDMVADDIDAYIREARKEA